MVEFTETAEEMMDARDDQGKLDKLTNGQLKFLGGGRPIGNQFVDVCRPGDELVPREGYS